MPSSSFWSLFQRLWQHLSPSRRREFLAFGALIVVSAFAEVLSFGAVIPFIGALTQPEILFRSEWISRFAHLFGFTQANELAVPLTLAFIAAAIFSGSIRMLLLHRNSRLAFASGADLSLEVYRRTLNQPYSVHISRNSSEVISAITTKVNGSVTALYNLLTLISTGFLLITILIALLVINPIATLLAGACFGTFYIILTRIFKKKLRRNSQVIAQNQTSVIKTLQEGLGGIRDVLLDNTQEFYCELYEKADKPFRIAQGSNLFLAGSPRFAMEAVGMIFIALLAYGFSRTPAGIISYFPMIGALAIGAQRLLPVLQQGFSAWASLNSNHASLEQTLALLDQPYDETVSTKNNPALPFQQQIELKNLSFRYTPDGPLILDRINLTIPKGARVGITGTTGSGKSTLLDLLMGLLTPESGSIFIDATELTSARRREWQKNIAHVPQTIFLADTTLAENVALGERQNQIHLDRVSRAVKLAKIDDFVSNSPEGLQTRVGERGVKLSGGQRQRIGIARALYKSTKVIVFDEATSALDQDTEKNVMEAIEGLDQELTIILIAHRISTLQNCNFIVQLEHGRVVRTGTFTEIFESPPSL